jgi:hypothetical protein
MAIWISNSAALPPFAVMFGGLRFRDRVCQSAFACLCPLVLMREYNSNEDEFHTDLERQVVDWCAINTIRRIVCRGHDASAQNRACPGATHAFSSASLVSPFFFSTKAPPVTALLLACAFNQRPALRCAKLPRSQRPRRPHRALPVHTAQVPPGPAAQVAVVALPCARAPTYRPGTTPGPAAQVAVVALLCAHTCRCAQHTPGGCSGAVVAVLLS